LLFKCIFLGAKNEALSKRELKLKEALDLAVRALFDYTSLYGADEKDELVYLAYKELCRSLKLDECCNLDKALSIDKNNDSRSDSIVISSRIATRIDTTLLDECIIAEKLLSIKKRRSHDDIFFLGDLKPLRLTIDNTWGYDMVLKSIDCSYRGDEIALTRGGLSVFRKPEKLSVFDVTVSISGCVEARKKNGTITLLRKSTNDAIVLDKNWIIEG
jgi:hypothetical protein